jgi:hypothetical protein
MKNKLKFLLIAFCIYLMSCNTTNNSDSTEKSILNTLNKTINLDMFEYAYSKNKSVTMDEIRMQFEFLSLVYLKDGCAPCYPKYVDWHNKMDSIGGSNRHSIIFIIEGGTYSSFEKFQNETLKFKPYVDKYFTIIDTNYKFLDGNSEIPLKLIENSLLIDRKNKIKLIGPPYINPEMTKLFFEIIKD